MDSSLQTDAAVRVEIKYLAAVRDRTGQSQEQVGFSPRATLLDVAKWLNRRYALSLPSPHVIAILNGRGWEQYPSGLSTEIKEGDIICLFPVIAGG